MIIRILLFCLGAYLLVLALMFIFQRKLLYLPSDGVPTAAELDSRNLQFWPTEQDYRGFITVPSLVRNKGIVVIFHGNAGSAFDRDYYVRALVPLGYRVLLLEYPGYGARAGVPSESLIVTDARAALTVVRSEFEGPLILWGESLGAGVAAAVLAEDNMDIEGVVLLTAWDSLAELAQSIYWFLPARWLLRDRYDSIENLRGYSGRVAVITAGEDRVIPNSHSLNLFKSLSEEKRHWHFEHAGHNSWPSNPDAQWWVEVMNFVAG